MPGAFTHFFRDITQFPPSKKGGFWRPSPKLGKTAKNAGSQLHRACWDLKNLKIPKPKNLGVYHIQPFLIMLFKKCRIKVYFWLKISKEKMKGFFHFFKITLSNFRIQKISAKVGDVLGFFLILSSFFRKFKNPQTLGKNFFKNVFV